MGKITISILHRLNSINEGSAALAEYLQDSDIEMEYPEVANDLYVIDGLIWGLIRDIEESMTKAGNPIKGE